MKKVVALLVVTLMVGVLFVSKVARSEVAPAGMKIAVVDLAKALNEVDEGKKAKAALEKEFKAKKTELDNMKNSLTTQGEALEKDSRLLSQDAMKTKGAAYQQEFQKYQLKAKEYTEQLAKQEGETTGKIIGKLRTVVESIAKKDGYTFVFEKSQGAVVYGPENADITSQVISQYNSGK